MLIIVSPAKSLDYETPAPDVACFDREPQFLSEAASLAALLRKQSPAQLAALMKISDPLAELNARRFNDWTITPDAAQIRPAVFAFDGDVYQGLAARSLSASQREWLDRHLRILSGLYGCLRPFDPLQAYRLEMGTRLSNPAGKDLYAYWGDHIAQTLCDQLDQQAGEPVLINLASEEYFKAVRLKVVASRGVRVITPVFEDVSRGQYRVVPFFAKKARGLMTRYAALHQIRVPAQLKDFDLEGYRFATTESLADRWVFRRPQPD